MIKYIDDKKVCSKCGVAKDVSLFDIFPKCGDGLYPSCKSCKRIVKEIHRKANPEQRRKAYGKHYAIYKDKIKARTTEYTKRNPDIRKKCQLNYYYGLSLESYQALVDKNNGKCHICNCVPDKFYVDHCHVTNKIRGVLCVKCNSLLGFCNDDIEILKSATEYLTKEHIYGVANCKRKV